MAGDGRPVTATTAPGRKAEWLVVKLVPVRQLRPRPAQPQLASRASAGPEVRASAAAPDFRLVTARGCRPYPEAGPGATGRPFRGANPDGTVFGFADTHLHITADLRAGGRVDLTAKPFDRFGITEALGPRRGRSTAPTAAST